MVILLTIYNHQNLKNGLIKVLNLPNTSVNSLAPALNYFGNEIRLKFNGGCLKQDKITFTHGKTVNIYTVY